jgi:hypothetical protein
LVCKAGLVSQYICTHTAMNFSLLTSALWTVFVENNKILDIKLLLCSECCKLSFGWLTPPMKMGQSIPKHWHLNYRHWWITQKIAYIKKLLVAAKHNNIILFLTYWWQVSGIRPLSGHP